MRLPSAVFIIVASTYTLIVGCNPAVGNLAEPVGFASSARGSAKDNTEQIPAAEGQDTIVLDSDGQRVFRKDSAGKERWSTTLDGYLGLVRQPHLCSDSARVYVTHGDGVTALDAAKGSTVWHSPGSADHLLLSDGLLLAVNCYSAEYGGIKERLLLARTAATGAEAFRVALPLKNFEPSLSKMLDLYLVQDMGSMGKKETAFLIDRSGKIRHRFDRPIVTASRCGNDYLFLTGQGVVRSNEDGKVLWTVNFNREETFAGGGFVQLPDGNMIAFVYCQGSNSGVQVMRINPEKGTSIWYASCASLPNVVHSGYNHRAEVVRKDGRLRIISTGDAGQFVEDLDEQTDQSLSRTYPK